MARRIRTPIPRARLTSASLAHHEEWPGETKITLVDYDADGVHERHAATLEECFPYRAKPSTTWIDVSGLQDQETIKKLAEGFQLHPLTIEDVLDMEQRPKLEEFDHYVVIIVKKPVYYPDTGTVSTDQISIILTQGTVISLHQRSPGMMSPLRARMAKEWSQIRQFGADFLAYALVDSIVDDYFIALEGYEERIEKIEVEVLKDPDTASMKLIHEFKLELSLLRRSVWPLREVVAKMQRASSPLLDTDIKAYTKDLQESIVQIIDGIETFRDTLSGILDLHLSTLSHHTNQVMKTLTMMASLFIPLTVITGIYGMNFKYMPELSWRFGYPACLGLMALIAIGMLGFFKRRGWI